MIIGPEHAEDIRIICDNLKKALDKYMRLPNSDPSKLIGVYGELSVAYKLLSEGYTIKLGQTIIDFECTKPGKTIYVEVKSSILKPRKNQEYFQNFYTQKQKDKGFDYLIVVGVDNDSIDHFYIFNKEESNLFEKKEGKKPRYEFKIYPKYSESIKNRSVKKLHVNMKKINEHLKHYEDSSRWNTL